MKRKFAKSFALLLTFAMLCGCSKKEPSDNPVNGSSTGQPENPATQQETQMQGTDGTEGYYPWIDSDLKENITKDMKISEKDDFHLSVNYDWLLGAEIPDGYSSADPFMDVSEEVRKNAKALLTDESLTGHDAELVQALYRAFMDWDTRDALGMKPVIPVVEDIQGIDSISGLSDFICDMDRSGMVPTMLGFSNDVGLDDATSYITYAGSDGFLLEDAAEYRERTDFGELYYSANKTAAVALLVRVGYETADAEKLFDAVIDFEGKIAEKALTSEDQMDPGYYQKINNVMTKEELLKLSPSFPMEKTIEALGYGEAEKFLVMEPAVLERVNELYTEENLESIKDYMIVRYLLDRSSRLDREAYEIAQERSNALYGVSGQKPDEDKAYGVVKTYLAEPLARVYLSKYDAQRKKQEITQICEDVIAAYKEMLNQVGWLTEETRKMAISKLDHITIHAVYPEKWNDYSELSLEGLSYNEAFEALVEFSRKLDAARTNQKVDRELWNMDILETNAYYNPLDNSINIILGILGSEFYNDKMSKEELYGGIGSVIGHEISHAFDTNGAQFDEDGNMTDWWEEQDYIAFMERADRLVAYYDTIVPYEGEKVRGNNIQSEAIADMTGVKCMLIMAEKEENFDYDKFFRQYANIWKEIVTPELEAYCLTQDVHPLQYLRTNVTLQQFEKFYETYDIKPGDGMYLAPEDRISVW